MIKENKKTTIFTKQEIKERVAYSYNSNQESKSDRKMLEFEIKHLAKR